LTVNASSNRPDVRPMATTLPGLPRTALETR
jgi:hypothetical protein